VADKRAGRAVRAGHGRHLSGPGLRLAVTGGCRLGVISEYRNKMMKEGKFMREKEGRTQDM
jgi:hypothetical protein